MAKIVFEDKEFNSQEGESVLDCLLRNDLDIPHSCKTGICHSCVMKCESGTVTANSQDGIKDSQKIEGYFKACVCVPEDDMQVSLEGAGHTFSTEIVEKKLLNERTLLVRLSVPSDFSYKSGQFINLIRPSDNLTRSYSLASMPSENFLEMHIRYYQDGKMSSWLVESVNTGDTVNFSGPLGDCFYTAGKESEPLLLAGIGTGMAPLYGIAREAVAKGHSGPITIIQGAMNEAGLYYTTEFRSLAETTANISYIASTVDGSGGNEEGKIDDVVKAHFPSLKGFRVYLCGSPNTVNRLKRYSFLSGANMGDIYSDPFTVAGS